jgi:hypothetical protein
VPTWFTAALAGLAVGVAVAWAAQERRLGGAFVDASPELGYARWGGRRLAGAVGPDRVRPVPPPTGATSIG